MTKFTTFASQTGQKLSVYFALTIAIYVRKRFLFPQKQLSTRRWEKFQGGTRKGKIWQKFSFPLEIKI